MAAARSEKPSPPVLTPEERELIQEARRRKVAVWKKLDLRQTWADEEHMRSFLTRYGVRVGSDFEPATPARLQTMLRRAGLSHSDWEEAVGCSLDLFLALNPRLPLWAAAALVLESAS